MDIKELLNECLQCKNPKCIEGCPAHNNIKEFIRLAKMDKYDEALNVINETSYLPSICSLVCPYERQCEGSCIKNKMGNPVKIHLIEQYIASNVKDKAVNTTKNNKKVALIGSGPASLSCAEKLISLGYSCDIFDKYSVPGGILTYGIPDFVLDKKIVTKKIEYLKRIGINFYMNKEYPIDVSIEYLKNNYDAIFLGFGATIAKYMGIENEKISGVIDANYFLEKMYRKDFSEFNIESIKNIVVVGGGNTAIDAARVAKKNFNADVSIVYRRSDVEMPARKSEYLKAIDDNINFNFLTNPIKYNGIDRVESVTCNKMVLKDVVDGRRKPVVIDGSDFIIKCDLVILAISSMVDKNLTIGLDTTEWGTIKVNEDYETSIPYVFASGDNVDGPSLVVTSMVSGIKAAEGIDKYLKSK